MHILVQIWFQLKFVTSIAGKRWSFHAQTYRWEDAGNAETQECIGPKGQVVTDP